VQRQTLSTPSGAVVDAHVLAARASTPLSCVDGALCIIDTDGVGTLDEPGCTFLMRTGFMAVRRAPWSGVIIAGPAALRIVVFGWTKRGIDSLGTLASGLAEARTFYGRGSIELAWRAAGELRAGDTFSSEALALYARAVALNLTRFAARKQGLEPTRALRARRTIEKRLADPLDLTTLARDVGCAPEYLSRLFRRTYGVSPSEFLLRRRTERARHLLAATRRPIADIAQQLGFYDTSHFARHFRHFSGISPAEFRARQAEVNSVPE
jgi:AraC-like DNA-binding protein